VSCKPTVTVLNHIFRILYSEPEAQKQLLPNPWHMMCMVLLSGTRSVAEHREFWLAGKDAEQETVQQSISRAHEE